MIVGGVTVECEFGLEGHSDADILLHAITDAVLGAAALGDIGMHFPDTDPRWKGAGSVQFLRHALDLAAEQGYRVVNVDTTVILERPKLKDYRQQMRESVAAAMGLSRRLRFRQVQNRRKSRSGWRRPVGGSAGDRFIRARDRNCSE